MQGGNGKPEKEEKEGGCATVRSGEETDGGTCKGIDIFAQGGMASDQDVARRFYMRFVYEVKKETKN
jgi:hypothetical protein